VSSEPLDIHAALEQTAPEVRRRARNRLSPIQSRFDADDLVQVTAMKATRAADTCRAKSMEDLRNWVLVIAKHTMLSELQKELGTQKRPVLVQSNAGDEAVAPEPQPLQAIEAAEETAGQFQIVQRSLDQIPQRQAAAIRMRYLEELGYPAIADRMGITVSAARTLVTRGLDNVRELSR